MNDAAKLQTIAQQAADRHNAKPPRLLFTSGYLFQRLASVYASCSAPQGLNSGVPVEVDVVDPRVSAHTGGLVLDDPLAQVSEGTCYTIPKGQTYLVKHLHNGIFAIVDQDGNDAAVGVHEPDRSLM